MTLEFHPEAERELIEAAAYYEERVPGLGERLGSEVRRSSDLLLAYPHIGSPVDPLLRKLVLTKFPFARYYSVTDNVIRIEVVAHLRRRPGYWRSRRHNP